MPSQSEFMPLYEAHRPRIYAYLLALVPHLDDADDLLQDVSVRLWKNFDKFREGTDFTAWSFSFVRYAAMNHYRRRGRHDRRITFNDELLHNIADRAADASWKLEDREESLRGCMQMLPDRSRQLVEQYYMNGGTMKSVAQEAGRSVPSITKAMSRIRGILASCVERRLGREKGCR